MVIFPDKNSIIPGPAQVPGIFVSGGMGKICREDDIIC